MGHPGLVGDGFPAVKSLEEKVCSYLGYGYALVPIWYMPRV